MKTAKVMFYLLLGLVALIIVTAIWSQKITVFGYCAGWGLAGFYIYQGQHWFEECMKELEK